MPKLSVLKWSVCFLLTLSLFSCKKDQKEEDTITEIENTVDLSAKQTTSEELADDVNNVMVDVLKEKGLVGGRLSSSSNCPAVDTSSLPGSVFPKTVRIDFGAAGCSMPNSSIVRKGVMIVVLSDSLSHPGATATVTFSNYYIGRYKKEGEIKWTNQCSATSRKWKRDINNVKITDTTSNTFWTNNGTKYFEELGYDTPVTTDDGFNITGNASIENSEGISRTSLILTPVHKFKECDYFDKGTIQFTGPNNTAVLDFGNGTCDNQAVLTINGTIIRNITL